VGNRDGNEVGVSVGDRVGTEVGEHVSKYDTVIFTSLPKSTQCPRQLENPIVCQILLSGILLESRASS